MNSLSSPNTNTTPEPEGVSLPRQDQPSDRSAESQVPSVGTNAPSGFSPAVDQPGVAMGSFTANLTHQTPEDSIPGSGQAPSMPSAASISEASSADTVPNVDTSVGSLDPTESLPSSNPAPASDLTQTPAPTPDTAPDTTEPVSGQQTVDATSTFNPYDTATSAAVFGAAAAVFSNSEQESSAGHGEAPKKNKKKLFAIIAAAVLGVVLLSSAVAFAIIRETPEMILRDAFFNTSAKTEGQFDVVFGIDEDGEKFSIGAKGAFQKNTIGSEITAEGDALPAKKLVIHQYAKDKKFYLKIDDLRKHIDGMTTEVPPEYQSFITMLNGFIDKVDSKWVVVTDDDLEKNFGIKPQQLKESTVCIEKALADYQSDEKQQQEVFGVYKKNQFITAEKQADEKVANRDAYHFFIKLDQQKAKSFGEALKTTAVYKNVQECEPEDEQLLPSSNPLPDEGESTPAIELWVDKQTRTLRKVQFKTTEEQEKKDGVKGLATAVFDFFSPVTMTEPKADVTMDELITEIQNLYGELMQQNVEQINRQAAEIEQRINMNNPAQGQSSRDAGMDVLGAQTEQPSFGTALQGLFGF